MITSIKLVITLAMSGACDCCVDGVLPVMHKLGMFSTKGELRDIIFSKKRGLITSVTGQ